MWFYRTPWLSLPKYQRDVFSLLWKSPPPYWLNELDLLKNNVHFQQIKTKHNTYTTPRQTNETNSNGLLCHFRSVWLVIFSWSFHWSGMRGRGQMSPSEFGWLKKSPSDFRNESYDGELFHWSMLQENFQFGTGHFMGQALCCYYLNNEFFLGVFVNSLADNVDTFQVNE